MSSSSHTDAETMASQILDQIRSIFIPSSSSSSSSFPPPIDVLLSEISLAASSSSSSARIFVHGVGREGLMLRALCMRLYHLGLSAHPIGDVTTPPASPGDLLIASAGPGGFSTVDAICHVARSAGARVVLITARPESESEARRCADAIAYLPARTMADDEEKEGGSGAPLAVRLPMGSLYEGALFVLFEMLVLRLAEVLGQSPAQLRSRHTNLE
ncbi:3-hexulose-6-phosphate isomerase-like [Dioscorea cayenensis subsp. rotundata]|uniref:3-hexulose-6-phosphate isomerase-like n=1 Tax=Dioscorea cayennensis subsp. rotundata TaxID=55577 RepID=A0AB40CVZ6_DIOCR|nr:3-hexulose-6-phosphate isomerase-like [Dioscorea cayenensis subsp. rotundata]